MFKIKSVVFQSSPHLSYSAWKLKTMLLLPSPIESFTKFRSPSLLCLCVLPHLLCPPGVGPCDLVRSCPDLPVGFPISVFIPSEGLSKPLLYLSKTLLLFAAHWSQTDQFSHLLCRVSSVKFLYFSSVKGSSSDHLPAL